jgi:hypothetical protein
MLRLGDRKLRGKALIKSAHCTLDKIRSLARTLRRREFDARKKSRKDPPIHRARDLPRLRGKRGRAWGWHPIFRQGDTHGKETSDGTSNTLLLERHACPKLVRLDFVEFAHGTILILVLLHISRRRIAFTDTPVSPRKRPRTSAPRSDRDLVHEPIRVIFK